jgi:hypothetical protein
VGAGLKASDGERLEEQSATARGGPARTGGDGGVLAAGNSPKRRRWAVVDEQGHTVGIR